MKQEIIELQDKAINGLLALIQNGKENITLKAPTGSGKTYMMAKLMNTMLKDENLIFLVSCPSKGALAKQNFDRFEELQKTFNNLRPFYISSGKEDSKSEGSLYIDGSCNVFVLPSLQLTKTSRIYKQQSLLIFLESYKNKKVILIKDESHIKTGNLDNLSSYFSQTINFSATPKDDKFDICIDEKEAVRANLIKSVEYYEKEKDLQEGLSEALDKFKNEIRPNYQKMGINPAFIIQISNEINAKEEFPKIKEMVEAKGLRWVYFVEKENDYESNTRLAKTNKSLWQNHIKQNISPVDVVIFKMVITEGFDMPRACMLYQVRNSQSRQLDEQVIGRVRRNPYLKDFENLDKEMQDFFSKAYVYGIKPKDNKRIKTQLKGEIYKDNLFKNEILREFKPFKIVILKEVPLSDIDIKPCIDERKAEYTKSIFDIYKALQNINDKVKEKQREFVTSYEKWFLFGCNIESIKSKVASVEEDYEKYGEMVEVESREDIYSFFNKSENETRITEWIWKNENDEFCFDSESEKEWFKVLANIKKYCKTIQIDGEIVYLFGKNFIDKSNIKFDYYDGYKKTSYPDFIFKDIKERIHIFEVKSINKGKDSPIDENEYKEKIKN